MKSSHIIPGPTGGPTATPKPGLMREAQNHVRYARAAVALSLICTAVACGYGSYRLLSDLEAELGYSQYDYVASSFGPILDDSVDEKILTLQSLGYHVETACASADTWPNCSTPMTKFDYLNQKQLSIAGLEAIGFCPVLTVEQVGPFEKYAHDFYESEPDFSFGIEGLGQRIYTMDPSGSGEYVVEVDSSNAKGNRDILVPLFQHSAVNRNPEASMFNLYSEPNRAAAIDRALDCAGNGDDCLAVTSPLNLIQRTTIRPASVMFYPVENSGNVVGVAISVFHWDQIIKGAAPSSAGQIYAVVHNAETDETFTFVFERGAIRYRGYGDRSSHDFPDLERTYSIDQFGEGVYSITISPTTEFMDDYQTNAPIIASVVSVCIILLTSLVFVAYDYFVKTQSQMHHDIMQSKRMFVRYISHEIRTPLNTVHLGMKVLYEELCDILKLAGNTPNACSKIESLIEFVIDIDESNECAVGVLNDLINYDKIVVGSLSLEAGSHDALSLITDTVRPFNVQAYKKNINLLINTDVVSNSSKDSENDTPSWFIHGDDMKLKQVLRNVVSNALKFTSEGGTISVKVSWSKEECIAEGSTEESRPAGSISIAVTDTGVGLSKESLAVVGGEYVQINARDLQSGGGSGLGLWISKNIVELHHGTMVVDSAGLGHGTTVTIELPVYADVMGDIETPTRSHSLRCHNDARAKYSDPSFVSFNDIIKSSKIHPTDFVTAEGTPSVQSLQGDNQSSSELSGACLSNLDSLKTVKSILVVDDVASTRKIIVRMLTRAGFDCVEAVNGQDCLDMIVQHDNIDLVLMDYEMPVMNGPDATRIISKRWGSKFPVVGLTGNVLQQDLDYFKSSGAVEVLVKPLKLKKLYAIIDGINVDPQTRRGSSSLLFF